MQKMNSRRSFLKGAALTSASLIVPGRIFARYEETAESQGNVVDMRCLIMSDVHFNGSPNAREVVRFQRALAFTYEYSNAQSYKNLDALVVVGDMSNHGNEAELTLFKKTMDAAVKTETQKVLCMGNHEFYGGNQEYWKSVFGVEPNACYDVNGYKFVMISPEKGTMADGDYLYKVDWLNEKLKAAVEEDPKRPIFVCQHYPVTPTVYGGRGYDDWGAEDLFDTLQKYPTVVDFSGHTHYPINDPRCAWQGCFTAFGTGTLSYLCHGHEGRKFSENVPEDGTYAQFYIMETRRDRSVTLKLYDLTTNSFFDVVYFVGKPGAISEYVYTDARYSSSEAPTWRERDVKTTLRNEDSVAIEFTQAHSRDVVVGYRVDLERREKDSDEWKPQGSRYFWSKYYLRDTPERINSELGAFDPGKYRGNLVAYNAFMKESKEKQTVEFEIPVSEKLANPNPKPDFYDIRVENDEVVNVPTNCPVDVPQLKKIGEPKLVADDELGGVAVVFDGKSCYRSDVSEEQLSALTRATVVAKFKVDPNSSGPGTIFSNTQHGGLALSYSSQEKSIQFWANVNGGYVTLSAPIETGKYYEAIGVYNGRRAALYLDGKEVASKEVYGSIRHTDDASARAFIFGADVATGGGQEEYFRGRVAYARLYSWGLSAEQIDAVANGR